MNKIYIISPAYFKTGGTELLHQLVFCLNKNGFIADIVYCDATDEKNINPSFREYVDSYVNIEDVLDDENNLCIFPETFTRYTRRFNKIRKAIWWESVDNYFADTIKYYLKNKKFKACLGLIFRKIFNNQKTKLSYKELKKIDYHFVQSYYAKDFAQKHKFQNIIFLSDYVNDVFISNSSEIDLNSKQNIVCYNPKKGKKFTNLIRKKSKNINFVPIENMTNQEVQQLLQRSKIYIDFGEHPGKDRFPREAAISQCIVITGMKGSAKFYEDVKINSEYKFKDKKRNIDKIILKLNDCLLNYEQHIGNFKEYQDYIKQEKYVFNQTVKDIFKEITNG